MSDITTYRLIDTQDGDHLLIATQERARFYEVLSDLVSKYQDHPEGGIRALNGRYRIETQTTVDGDDVSSWVWSFIR